MLQTLHHNGRSLDRFQGFLKRPEEMLHAYDKFRLGGNVYKPPFDEVYRTVKTYIKEVLPREKKRDLER